MKDPGREVELLFCEVSYADVWRRIRRLRDEAAAVLKQGGHSGAEVIAIARKPKPTP